MAMTIERGLLASYLDDGGWHTEAENVRNGIDLESYESDLRIIDWLRRHHITQPAQAVDVVAIREVVRTLERCAGNNSADFHRAIAAKLTRALAGEKAEGWRGGNLAERLERAEASAEHSRIARESDRRALAIVIHHYVGGAAIITPAMLDEMPTGITRIDRPDIAPGAVELRTKENWRDFHEEVGADGKPTGYLIFPTTPTDEEG